MILPIAKPKAWLTLLIGGALVSVLLSCAEKSAVEDQSQALVKVNQSVITQEQLDAAVESLLVPEQAANISAAGKQKILEGMVASRAISQLAESELEASLLLKIDNKTQLHREKLLLAEYMRRHVKPTAISDAQVKDYYQKHPQEFGGGKDRAFEYVSSIGKPGNEERPQLIEQLARVAKEKNWRAASADLVRAGYQVEYRKGMVKGAVLDARLLSLLQSTPVGASSNVSLVRGKPLIVRVLKETQLQPRPYVEVAEKIRQKLTPLSLKESVKKIQQRAVTNSEVEYY